MSEQVVKAPSTASADATKIHNAVKGAAIGFFVDMFDVYLPVIALAPAMVYFVSPELSVEAKALIAGIIFAATLVARPLGSAIFGVLADRVGRKRATISAVLGCGVLTAATAVLPGYQQVGVLAIVLLVAVRFVGGIFMGGEYTGAVPLAMESSPIRKRGWYGGVIAAAFPLAYCVISLIVFVLLAIMPAEGLGSSYVQWGWRIPFLLGGLGTFWFAWYYARSVSESETWRVAKLNTDADAATSEQKRGKFGLLFSGSNRRAFVRVFVLMTGVWFVSNVVTALLPAIINRIEGVTATGGTFVWLVAQFALVGGYLLAGVVSQRLGRRRFFTGVGFAMVTVAATAVTLLSTGVITGYLAITLVAIVALFASITAFGSVPTLVCESFPVDVRGTGYGLGYGLAVVIPSFYAFYQQLLGHVMPAAWTPTVLLVVGGVLVVAGALIGPETRDRDLALTTAELEARA